MISEKVDRCIGDTEQCLFVMYDWEKLLSFVDLISEQSTEGNQISAVSFPRIRRTGLHAAAAVVTLIAVDRHFVSFTFDCTLTARLFADTAADTFILNPGNFHAAFDSDIIFLSL